MVACQTIPGGRRKLFWATQPDACGSSQDCGNSCGVPGLAYVPDTGEQKTIATSDWVRGLILNMLMTDGRRPGNNCGYAPNGQGGHWSESYSNGDTIGTLLRTVESSGRISELIALLRAHVESTMQRLIKRGVAISVEVNVMYLGNSRFQIGISALGTNNQMNKVGMTAERMTNAWIWSADQ